MKKTLILFQGDSITDAGRDKRNYHQLGNGYPKFAAAHIAEAHPDTEFEFINLGISGNRTDQLFDRLYPDAIALQPDIISILIGINDIWHRKSNILTTDAQFELNYRTILTLLRERTNAKIVMLAPYVLDAEDKEFLREDHKKIIPIVRALAEEFADVYIPLDEKFEEAVKTQPEPRFYSGDGVHPNQNGAAFIGKLYAEAIDVLLK
ncbi:MAG: SGNH/GDSL hydrolase family protein [Clostridia bacterium]|nr:SGNH/GDSL hydrolase family protein [Clostridia bacterium]